jgi:hypothetical protein
MRNRWADEFERAHRSPACVHGTHNDCPHLYGFGGGLNPRRFRLEFGAGLCKCDCHSSCPVTSRRVTVPMQAWRESCSCPGSADERIRQDEASGWPDFQEERAKYQRDYQLRQEAFRAARAKTAGKNREEIKDLTWPSCARQSAFAAALSSAEQYASCPADPFSCSAGPGRRQETSGRAAGWSEQAEGAGSRDRLGATVRAELGEEVAYVRPDRVH